MEQLAESRRSARMLLAAWDRADRLEIRNAADLADTIAPVSTWEAERIEMIREAGGVLRQWTEGSIGSRCAASVDIDASLHLLRHFAA